MAKPDLEWTLDDAPVEGEPPAAPPGRVPPPNPPAPRPSGQRPRRGWLGLAAIFFLMAVAALAVQFLRWRGEQNILAQLTAEVEYEDAQARGGNVAAAMSVWFHPLEPLDLDKVNPAWWQRRQAEAQLGLAAPLPLPGLTPVDAPPRVTGAALLASGTDQWDVTVVRAYVDTAGRTMEFALTQRYRNLGPGLWERVPPDSAALKATTFYTGQRLFVALPQADLDRLRPILDQVDALLEQACTGWGAPQCPANQYAGVQFVTDPRLGPPPLAPGLGLAAGHGPYPLALEIGAYVSPGMMLFSPQLVGVPVDEAGRAALTHALTVLSLINLANAAAGPTTRVDDLWRDALAARAEQRLGLAGPLTYTATATDFLLSEQLWAAGVEPQPAAQVLPARLQALRFLDQALAGEPPATDGLLLSYLHRRPELSGWLDEGLGAGQGAPASLAWDAQAEAVFAAAGNLDWGELEGLRYACGGRAYLVRRDGPLALPERLAINAIFDPAEALSPDGQWLAAAGYLDSPEMTLRLYDLEAQIALTVTQASDLNVAGWSAAGALIYAVGQREPGVDATFQLWRYELSTGQAQPLTGALPGYPYPFTWLPDHRRLLMPVGSGTDWVPMLMAVDDLAQPPQPLSAPAWYPSLRPDGRALAYVSPDAPGTVVLYDLANGTRRTLFDLSAQSSAAPVDDHRVTPLAWTGDSQWLLVLAPDPDAAPHLYLVPAAGGEAAVDLGALGQPDQQIFPFSVGRSPSGRYLAFRGGSSSGPTTLLDLSLVDVDQRGKPTGLRLYASAVTSAAWSPRRDQLALGMADGLQVTDFDTGLTRWLSHGATCDGVVWYSARESP